MTLLWETKMALLPVCRFHNLLKFWSSIRMTDRPCGKYGEKVDLYERGKMNGDTHIQEKNKHI